MGHNKVSPAKSGTEFGPNMRSRGGGGGCHALLRLEMKSKKKNRDVIRFFFSLFFLKVRLLRGILV